MYVLLDGRVSYLLLVLVTGAPNAHWGLGSPGDRHHHLYHHPVLIGRGHQIYIPTLPLGGVLRLKRGERSLHTTELENYATGVIEDLRTSPHAVPAPQDFLLEVVAETESFDVGVHTAIAERNPRCATGGRSKLARRRIEAVAKHLDHRQRTIHPLTPHLQPAQPRTRPIVPAANRAICKARRPAFAPSSPTTSRGSELSAPACRMPAWRTIRALDSH